jgi:hypothetical protein
MLLPRFAVRHLRIASAVARLARKIEPLVLFFILFGAGRVPARCTSNALPQQNIHIHIIIPPGVHSSL